ncbi:MAG: nucleotidyltransferase domain-containing protein [Draconibacterium sp.]|nr:nucleotidyltransferase domain-containing protein [Draconibacterium sp.]
MVSKSKILQILKNHLIKNFNNSVNDVILFGSQATGKSHEFSDYDILIILGKEYSGNDENIILDLCYEIGIKYDIIFDVHILAESEINSVRGRQAVYSKAIKSGIYA